MTKLAVTIYTMTDCPFCARAKDILKEMKIPFTEKNVSTSIKFREEMVKRSKDDKLPTLVINNTVLVKPGEDKLRATINYEKHL
jgi:glutaredoxin 3